MRKPNSVLSHGHPNSKPKVQKGKDTLPSGEITTHNSQVPPLGLINITSTVSIITDTVNFETKMIIIAVISTVHQND